MLVKFRFRRDTAANWTAANPVLALGEPGLETDTRKVKYGDGATAWTALAYGTAAFTGTLPVANGGLGVATLNASYLLKGNGTSAVSASIVYDTGSAVLIGTTSSTGLYNGANINPGVQIEAAGTLSIQRNNLSCMLLGKASGATDANYSIFYSAGSQIGSISRSGSTTVYATTSDQTKKIDDGPFSAEDARRVLELIRIHNFRWKDDNEADVGVFAQELYKVWPRAVVKGGQWRCGKTARLLSRKREGAVYVPWSVNWLALMPIIIRGMQDHETRIAALEAAIAA